MISTCRLHNSNAAYLRPVMLSVRCRQKGAVGSLLAHDWSPVCVLYLIATWCASSIPAAAAVAALALILAWLFCEASGLPPKVHCSLSDAYHIQVDRLVRLPNSKHCVCDNVCQLLSKMRSQLGHQAGAAHTAQQLQYERYIAGCSMTLQQSCHCCLYVV